MLLNEYTVTTVKDSPSGATTLCRIRLRTESDVCGVCKMVTTLYHGSKHHNREDMCCYVLQHWDVNLVGSEMIQYVFLTVH